MHHLDPDLPVQKILSGKFRRYHHLSLLRQLLWPQLVLLNLRDSFLVLLGFVQSIIKLLLWRPDVVFTKGGYVCLPVGLAAKLLRIPLVIHDSDAHPGLTNRVLSRWASAIATGAPLKYYSYPTSISRYVGIPISADFHPFSTAEQQTAKQLWGLAVDRPLTVITGGGLGAQLINDSVALHITALLQVSSVVLIAGTAQYDALKSLLPPNSDHFQLHSFVSRDMAELLGAADVVVTRAGATTILELAALAKPTILIPNGKLTGGHQLKNAAVYADAEAVEIVTEQTLVGDPLVLPRTIARLLNDKNHSQAMAARFAHFARPDAAKDMAEMIIAASL